MKILDFLLVIISTLLLVINQIFVKFWIVNRNISVWPINIEFFKNLFSYEILISVISMGFGGFLWIALLKKIEFSILYPLISISYIFGLLAAVIIFEESVPLLRWIGVLIIILGIFLITRS